MDPQTYLSVSGKWRLDVDPSSIDGGGAADYVLKDNGKAVWQGRKPFTLLNAEVTDEGVVAGYAYSGGLMSGDGSKIHLVILDSRGALVLDSVEDRHESNVIDGGPEPWVNGLLLDRETDRVTFRVGSYQGGEKWKTFRLSNGRGLSTYELKGPEVDRDYAWLNGVRVVRGTPFNLVAWGFETEADEKVRPDIRFALLDTAGKVIWRYELQKDRAPLAMRGDSSDFDLPAILPHNERGEFEIRAFRTGEWLRFRVSDDPKSGIRVSEIGRGAYEAPGTKSPAQTLIRETTIEAQELPPIALGRDQESDQISPTRGIQHFDIDSKGRFGFARRDAACAITFVLLDGKETKEHELGSREEKPKECHGPLVAWAGGTTWLVTQEFAKAGSGSIGWWVDVNTGGRRPFTLPEPLMARAVAGTGQGAVVLLASDDNFASTLLWLDTTNRENNGFRKTFEADRGELLSPEDVTVTSAGDIAVIDVIRHIIEVFDRSGAHKRSIDLEAKWGREPSYPSGLSADAAGGFFVDDFGATLPLVRITDTGSIRAESSPRYEHGAATGRIYRVRVAPDGRIWGSDGEALLQFDDRGVVVDSIGPSAGIDRLGEIAAWAMDRDERIYAADRRSGTVHVFDAKGVELRACAPAPGQVTDALNDPSLSVSGDGRILLRAGRTFNETEAFLEFSPSCAPTSRDVAASSLLWTPSMRGFWAQRFEELALLDIHGSEVLGIKRRIDRHWLGQIYNSVVANDGSVAVASGARKDDGGSPEGWALSVFGPDGKARSMAFLPRSIDFGSFGFDGRRIVAWDEGRLRVMSVDGKSLALLGMPMDLQKAGKMPILLRRDGLEAWILDGERGVVHRVPLP